MANSSLKTPSDSANIGGPGFTLIVPPNNLSNKTRIVTNPGFDPIGAAEAQIKLISAQNTLWLKQEEIALRSAADKFAIEPDNAQVFQILLEQVHIIKGNAAILGCPSASVLAGPLAKMLERCPKSGEVQSIIKLAVSAICGVLHNNTSLDDATLSELISTLNSISSKC